MKRLAASCQWNLGMGEAEDRIMEEATGWAIRLHHAGKTDWEEFVAWLEADERHWAAYRAIARIDLKVASLLPHQSPERTLQGRAAWARRGFLTAGAAAAAAAIAYMAMPGPAALYSIETGPGERRTVTLAGRTKIDLNGGTRVLLDRKNARFARLERGEALFDVEHIPSDPFRVEASDALIRNVGTVFNVRSEGDTLTVEVAEGAVLFSADGEQLSLVAGRRAVKEANRITLGSRDRATIGSWQRGELSYSAATYTEIARDLARNSGIQVQASPDVGRRRFSGVILLDGDREDLRRRVATLLGVEVRLAGEGWILAPADR